MFEIDSDNLPVVRTRQALLALDLQNDIVSTGSLLHVEEPPNFVANIVDLASHFRASDKVIWIRSVFNESRAVNSTHGDSEKVITDRQLVPTHRGNSDTEKPRPRPSDRLLARYSKIIEATGLEEEDALGLQVDEQEVEAISETFLTVEPGGKPQIVLPSSTGANLTYAVSKCLDGTQDLIFMKNHYSAFKDGSLVQILRANFVTEIFICGALTNISVFATAMDAARHGYAITIIEDCLGYRSKARHDEALRRLEEFTGCDIIKGGELVKELQRKAKVQQPPQRRNPRPREKDSSLERLMSNLRIKPEPSTASKSSATPPGLSKSSTVAATASSSESQLFNESHEKLPAAPVDAEPKKRERVKTKIKTRRRQPEPAPNDAAAPGPSTAPPRSDTVSPTSATLLAASKALEKMPELCGEGEPTHPSKDIEPNESVPAASSTEKAKRKDGVEDTGDSPELSLQANKDHEPRTQEVPTPICEGDTTVITNLLSDDLSKDIFERIRDEVRWQKMSHQGGDVPRLVAVQGDVAEDGSIPIYRHPADESPPLLAFSPVVSLIRAEVEKKLGHAVNHVLIQFYRDGTDHISEHSDKTLDIVPNTFIANVSLGAQRTMVFRTKKAAKSIDAQVESAEPRKTCRAPLPHNSMCKMGLLTNMRWLHGIRPDKRMESEKSEAELAFNGGRISLTFRLIGTFLDKDQQKIWGQGALSKIKDAANNVINGNTPEAEKMIRAFGKENHSTEFDWEKSYGAGFDVLHISNSPKLFLSGDNIADLRVKILLAEYGISWTEGKLSPSFNWKNGSSSMKAPAIPESLPVKFVDNDLSKSTVIGDLAIMLYLDAVYGPKSRSTTRSQVDLARQFTRFHQANELLNKWRAIPFSVKPFRRELEHWEAFANEATFIAGSTISLADYALFPIFDDMAAEWGPGGVCEFQNLCAYFERMRGMESVKKALAYEGESSS